MILLLLHALTAQAGDIQTCVYKTFNVDNCNYCVVSQCGDEIQGIVCTEQFCPVDLDINADQDNLRK
jgi:hypothetical protein